MHNPTPPAQKQIREECVHFNNGKGLLLRGILHHADPELHKNITLICLNTGLNDMVGWHRLQVKMARFFAGLGFAVLRYDDEGIGDSEGEILDTSIVKIFSDIETGMFVNNADCAVAFTRTLFPRNKIVYLGFCGGGLTAIHSASVNQHVDGVINIGGPVTLASKDYLNKTDPWEVQRKMNRYRNKIMDKNVWRKLITLDIDFENFFRSFWHFGVHKLKGSYRESEFVEDIDDMKNLNKLVFFNFEKFVKRKCPCLFFYAEHDSATWELKKYFLARYQDKYFTETTLNDFVEIQQANHIFSSDDSQKALKDGVLAWLGKHFIP